MTYRFAASIQIVVVLTLLIYISNCPITALFIILLALFNDLTMLPIAYDYQNASSTPENPDVANILTVSAALGSMETVFTLLFAYANGKTGWFEDDYTIKSGCSTSAQAAVWLQMFIATELLIFSARAPSYIFFSLAPSPALACSVFIGCLVASLMAGLTSTFGDLGGTDIVLIWAYNIVCLFVIDVVKVMIFKFYNLNTEVLKDVAEVTGPLSVSEKPAVSNPMAKQNDVESSRVDSASHSMNDEFTRESISTSRLTDWAVKNDPRLSSVDRMSQARSNKPRRSSVGRSQDHDMEGRISVVSKISASASELRPSTAGVKLRPNTPANRKLK